MKRIPLTKGKEALVDDEDYEFLMQWSWYYTGGYARRTETQANRRVSVFMHNVVAHRADIQGPEVDHRDRDPLNNQRYNLRPATRCQQARNRGLRRDSKSRCIGVTWRARLNRWEARILYAGRYQYLGVFVTKEEAAKAYNDAARKHFGDFAVLNPL